MDASAIMQDDTSIENLQAMTDFTREYGVYSAAFTAGASALPIASVRRSDASDLSDIANHAAPRIRPGICRPWAEKAREIRRSPATRTGPPRLGKRGRRWASTYIWQLLLSF